MLDIDNDFTNDIAIPDKTVIYFARGKSYYGLAVNLMIGLAGIYFLTMTSVYFVVGLLLALVGFLFSYKFYKNVKNTDPQIVLSDNGIQTSTTQYYDWTNVKNEKITTEKDGTTGDIMLYYLTYDNPSGSEKFLISALNTDIKTMTRLLTLYRGRNNTKNYYR